MTILKNHPDNSGSASEYICYMKDRGVLKLVRNTECFLGSKAYVLEKILVHWFLF